MTMTDNNDRVDAGRHISPPCVAPPEPPTTRLRMVVREVVEVPADLHPIAVHEAGHAVVARALGLKVQTVTIVENEAGGWRGACVGDDQPSQFVVEAFARIIAERYGAAREIAPLGINRADSGAGTFILGGIQQTIFDLAGPVAERIAMGDGYDPAGSAFDHKNARSRAGAMCWSDAATDAFLVYAETEARALLTAHWCAVEALVAVLLAEKTLRGQNVIDNIITQALVARDRRDQRAEQQRMSSWQDRLAALGVEIVRTK